MNEGSTAEASDAEADSRADADSDADTADEVDAETCSGWLEAEAEAEMTSA